MVAKIENNEVKDSNEVEDGVVEPEVYDEYTDPLKNAKLKLSLDKLSRIGIVIPKMIKNRIC